MADLLQQNSGRFSEGQIFTLEISNFDLKSRLTLKVVNNEILPKYCLIWFVETFILIHEIS